MVVTMGGIFGSETTDTVAKMLAGEHMKDDAAITCVLRLPDEHEVRLIEITESVPATGEVLPFRFTPDPPGVPYSSLVILLHPDDWKRRDKLDWPPGLDPSAHAPELIAGTLPDGNGG